MGQNGRGAIAKRAYAVNAYQHSFMEAPSCRRRMSPLGGGPALAQGNARSRETVRECLDCKFVMSPEPMGLQTTGGCLEASWMRHDLFPTILFGQSAKTIYPSIADTQKRHPDFFDRLGGVADQEHFVR